LEVEELSRDQKKSRVAKKRDKRHPKILKEGEPDDGKERLREGRSDDSELGKITSAGGGG